MRIGFVGLGKLGLPVAMAIQSRGHQVLGFDINRPKSIVDFLGAEAIPPNWDSFVTAVPVALSLAPVLDFAEIVFVAVQTPHAPEFEGITPLPDERRDFDYTHLARCLADIRGTATKPLIVTVISTVLPGTMRRLWRETGCADNPNLSLVYNPSFIAMGTTIRDFLEPEFVLIGTLTDTVIAATMEAFYRPIVGELVPIYHVGLETAELAKVAYNTFIGFKVAFGNILGEITDAVGGSADDVAQILGSATRRLMSPAYMRPGMGDGGACHPRDNIAMSWLARDRLLTHDIFHDVMQAREDHARRLAVALTMVAGEARLPIAIYGIAYKADSALTFGSHALLVDHFVREITRREPHRYDPIVWPDSSPLDRPAAILIGCNHTRFRYMKVAPGSIVLDPWSIMALQDGIKLVRLGRLR